MKGFSSRKAFSAAMTDTLRDLLKQRALTTGQKVTLSTGRESNFYLNCKAVTLSSDGASLIADAPSAYEWQSEEARVAALALERSPDADRELDSVDVCAITPLDALNLLFLRQKRSRRRG